VTRQETTFTRTISTNQRLQQKQRKKNISIWPAKLSVKVVSKLMSWFSPSYSGALVNATTLMLLLESFAKKAIQSRKGVRKGWGGLKPPLNLIFYKNFITCSKEI